LGARLPVCRQARPDGQVRSSEFRNGEIILNEKPIRFRNKFIEAMDDDFNTAKAIAVVFELAQFSSSLIDKHFKEEKAFQEILYLFNEFGEILGLNFIPRQKEELPTEIQDLIKRREKLRAEKKWKEADEIRMELGEKGFVLEDSLQGTRWKKKS
jgi:cysteinyl-tRNA synthetase